MPATEKTIKEKQKGLVKGKKKKKIYLRVGNPFLFDPIQARPQISVIEIHFFLLVQINPSQCE